MALIKHRAIEKNVWRSLGDGPDADTSEPVYISLDRFTDEVAYWTARSGPWGLSVSNDIEPQALTRAVDLVMSIAIVFPKYTDGRGYTLARLLRRGGYERELRATGDVLHDQLSYMERCGFDAFDLKDTQDAAKALAAFEALGQPYQGAADTQEAQWRRFG
jgi:uncharacterized protein (DUF934 family)